MSGDNAKVKAQSVEHMELSVLRFALSALRLKMGSYV